MKAIFGIIGTSNLTELKIMSDKLNHRGKHFIYEVIDDKVKLGFNSIDNDSRFYVEKSKFIAGDIFIYNKKELIENLKTKDVTLNSNSNSNEELLLKIYSFEGVEGLRKINGDFSFIIWDNEKKLLTLGRDFFGCCPLYYTKSPHNFSFASEYKAFINESNSPSPDYDMIQCLQHGKRLPPGHTLFKEIESVLPGSILEYDFLKDKMNVKRMKPLKLNIIDHSVEEISKKIIDQLSTAIVRRINVLGKPIGISLSGGIDSIALTYLCRQAFPQSEIYTFTAGYGKNDFELLTAKKVAERLNTNHIEIITPPTLMKKKLKSVVWHMEDPYSRSEALQLYEIGRVASKHVKYLLSAQGADGLFGGMPKYKLLYYTTKLPFLKNFFMDIYNLTQLGIQPTGLLGKLVYYYYFMEKIPFVPQIKENNYSPSLIEFPSNGEELLNRMLINGFQTGISQDIIKFERNFAAWGVYYTSPFYDLNFVDFAYSISDKFKIFKGREKYIFRKSLEGIIPKNLVKVPKLPQRMLYDQEFSSVLDEVLDRYMSKEKVNRRGLFKHEDIQRLRRKNLFKPYKAEHAMRLWTLITTEIWAENFIDQKNFN